MHFFSSTALELEYLPNTWDLEPVSVVAMSLWSLLNESCVS
jgi:hypothetical protein